MLVLRVGVFPLKGILLASKLGEVNFCKRVNLVVSCSIYCTVSSACATMSGMRLIIFCGCKKIIEFCSQLMQIIIKFISVYLFQTLQVCVSIILILGVTIWPVTVNPPIISAVQIWVWVDVAGRGIILQYCWNGIVLSNQPSSCCMSSSILLVSDTHWECYWFKNNIVFFYIPVCTYLFSALFKSFL